MTRRQTHFAALLALLALGLIIFRELAFTDRILGRGDTYVYFYPYWTVRDAFFRAGQLPLWTPDLFMGAPLLANPQLGALYPPNWLTIPLDAPNSIRVAILLHVAWAALGAYLLAWRAVRLRTSAALVTAAIFAFGGYLGAHVEQVNQLQGLSWFPWTFLLLHMLVVPLHRREGVRATILLLGGALALQFLAGHTQTVFINGVGLALYALAAGCPRGLLALAASGGGALVLASPQLIPTLELIGESGRSGGLSTNAALSFSLNPFIAARGLLPSYDGKIFSEYIAYIGVAGLVLAVLGALTPKTPSVVTPSENQEAERGFRGEVPHRRVWIIIVIAALALAAGAYNPLNWLIVQLPGFDLFRVPARWLALYALGTAVLAGMGVEVLFDRVRTGPALSLQVVIPFLVLVALFGLSFLAGRVPEEINGFATPTRRTLAGWGVAMFAVGGVWWFLRQRTGQAPSLQAGMVGVVFVELIAASWILPYNDLVPPDVWSAQRFSISQMLAYTETDANGLTADGTPPGRLLSISGLFFDPGDQNALSARYQALGMTPLEERYSFVAAKLKETLSPNLPLAWGIPTVDGFGGGLLPTRHYVDFMALAYPDGVEVAVDGRLRENLALARCRGACVPWDVAGLLDMDYVLVDKVYDVWHEGVAFDTTFTRTGEIPAYPAPDYPATAVQVLYTCPDTLPDCALGDDDVSLADGLRLATLPAPAGSVSLPATDANVIGVSLVDDRLENQFVQLTPPEWSRVLSSDVKLYRGMADAPRAYIGAETDDPTTLIRTTNETVSFVVYTPTYIEIEAQTLSEDNVLVLQDSYYPGWTATVNESSVTVSRANVNFRAVPLPTGTSRVIFGYNPWWFPGVLVFGAAAWSITTIMCIFLLWRRQRD